MARVGPQRHRDEGGRHIFTDLRPYVNCYSILITLVHDYTYYLR